MWNPTPYSTLALFVCSDPTVKLGHFRLSMSINIRIRPFNKLKLKIFKYDDDTGLAVIMNISYNQYLVS